MSAARSFAVVLASAWLFGCASVPPPPEPVVASWYAAEEGINLEMRLLIANRSMETLKIHGLNINPIAPNGSEPMQWWVIRFNHDCSTSDTLEARKVLRPGGLWVQRIDGCRTCRVEAVQGRPTSTYEAFPSCTVPARLELIVERPRHPRPRRDNGCLTRDATRLGDNKECIAVDVRAALPSALPENWKRYCGLQNPQNMPGTSGK